MFIREIWGKFTSLIFLKFIPNVPLKYVITSTYFMPYLYTGYSNKKISMKFPAFQYKRYFQITEKYFKNSRFKEG